MPGVFQYSVDRMDEMLAEVAASGIAGVLIFGIPKEKDAVGSQAYAPDGITQRAIRHIKKKYPSLLVVADVCLCEYTSHGHCGLVEGEHILNDKTLPLLAKMSVTLAQAGADIIAPSDMMDGRVAAIRHALDEAGLLHIPIMAYSAKFASGYYGPFRDAAHSAPQFGDRRSYQMSAIKRRRSVKLRTISRRAQIFISSSLPLRIWMWSKRRQIALIYPLPSITSAANMPW